MSLDTDSLVAARAASIQNLLTLELAGPQAWADYSVDGGSYQFSRAKEQLQRSIDAYSRAIQQLGGPWTIRSRGV